MWRMRKLVKRYSLRSGFADPPQLRDVFTPTQPCSSGPLFVGREALLRRIRSAVEDERANIVLYGERGAGKTSVANAFAQVAREAGYIVVTYSCATTTTFDELFRSLLSKLPSYIFGPTVPGEKPNTLNLPKGQLRPANLVSALRPLHGEHVVAIIDEFDRARAAAMRVEIADAIKAFSDAKAPITLVIVGVAERLDQLVGQHPSIQRALLGLHLAPLEDSAVQRLVLAGAAESEIEFDADVVTVLPRFACGMPYYAHLLCLFAARSARTRGSTHVEMQDFMAAIDDALAKQEADVGLEYEGLIAEGPKMEQLLFGAAAAKVDAWGRFTADAVADAIAQQGGPIQLRPADIHEILSILVQRAVLHQQGAAELARYWFATPALGHYTLFRSAKRSRMLRTDDLELLKAGE